MGHHPEAGDGLFDFRRGWGGDQRESISRRAGNKFEFRGTGAFSEAAARRVDPGADLLPCRSFEDVFVAVDAGPAGYGVLPIENSIGGSIHRNYDLLLEHQLPIVGEVEVPVVHHLLALPGTTMERAAADLLASAGAGAVRAVSADADRRRDRRHLRHGRQREARGGRPAHGCGGDRFGAGGRSVRPRAARLRHPGLRRQHHALHRRRPAADRRGGRRQDVDRLLAAQRARARSSRR